jgi:hypothetical protein
MFKLISCMDDKFVFTNNFKLTQLKFTRWPAFGRNIACNFYVQKLKSLKTLELKFCFKLFSMNAESWVYSYRLKWKLLRVCCDEQNLVFQLLNSLHNVIHIRFKNYRSSKMWYIKMNDATSFALHIIMCRISFELHIFPCSLYNPRNYHDLPTL